MKMKKIIMICAVTVLFLVLADGNAHGADPNLPADFPEIVITKTADAAPGVFIGTMGSGWFPYSVVLDRSGYPLFYSKMQRLTRFVQPNGLIAVNNFWTGTFDFKDETFAVVDSSKMTPGNRLDTHDVKLLPNGHVLLIGKEYRYIDMSQIVAGGRPDASVAGDTIQEFDADKQVIFEWHSFDHIPITDSFHDLTRKSIDYAHINSAALDPLDNTILASLRTTSEIVKVSRSTGEVVWRLSGKGNNFTFIGEHEENAPYYTVGQHDVTRLLNGNLLYFDNGNIRGGGINPCDRDYSRAVEYYLDEVDMTATLVWEFRHTPDISAGCTGFAKRLDNGNTVVDWGCAIPSSGTICTEVSPSGEIVYEMSFPEPGPNASMTKQEWNSPDLVTSQTHLNIEAGQTYDSASTGVSVTVNNLTGSASNNGLVIKKHRDATRFPRFSGKAPQLLVKRVTMAGFGIAYLYLDATFDTQDLAINEPNQLTVYHRPYVGQGEFTALATTFDDINETLTVMNASLGEFVFGYPDAPEIPLQPILYAPEDLAMVNQAQPVVFQWTPRGFGRSYHLQVSTDAYFNNLTVDESGLKKCGYELTSVDPGTTYYWRVNTTNYGGTSGWATRTFTTVPPMVKVTVPNSCDNWNRGLDYFIEWNDNLVEDVVLELYKGETFVKTIRKVASIGAYEWEVDLALEPGCDYSIKVKSSDNEAIFDMSRAFCIDTNAPDDTTPPEFELSVTPAILWPPNHDMVLITPSLTVNDDIDPSPDVSLVGIVANEGDNTVGDGHTSDDIQICEDGSIYLRAERSGTGSSRIYTITYEAVDACGNVTFRNATVMVPHDR
jgi:hypothetical protein